MQRAPHRDSKAQAGPGSEGSPLALIESGSFMLVCKDGVGFAVDVRRLGVQKEGDQSCHLLPFYTRLVNLHPCDTTCVPSQMIDETCLAARFYIHLTAADLQPLIFGLSSGSMLKAGVCCSCQIFAGIINVRFQPHPGSCHARPCQATAGAAQSE